MFGKVGDLLSLALEKVRSLGGKGGMSESEVYYYFNMKNSNGDMSDKYMDIREKEKAE